MNPRLVRELDAEAAAIVRALDDLAPGQARDLSGHIDGKRAIMRRVEKLAKAWREGLAGGPSEPVSGPDRGTTSRKKAAPRASRSAFLIASVPKI